MLENTLTWKENVCTNCVNWDISNDPFGLLCFTPPENYPTDDVSEFMNGKLIPKRISNNLLKGSVNRAHNSYAQNKWNKKTLFAYLRVCSLKEKTGNDVFEHAENARIVANCNLYDDRNKDMLFLQEDILQNPHMYKLIEFPPAWDDVFDVKKMMLFLCIHWDYVQSRILRFLF